MFGCGHYGTVKAHRDRWLAFVNWCRSEQGPGINDARQIDRKVLADYAAYLRDVFGSGALAISTAQNRLSSVNTTMAALRGDQRVKLPSRSKALSMQRTGGRHSVPQGQDRAQVQQIVDVLCHQHQLRTAAIVLLAQASGCACARQSWLICHDYAVRPMTSARLTSRTAPRVNCGGRPYSI